MQSSGSNAIVMNVNRSGKERGNGEMMVLFAVAMGTGYFLGSSTSLSLASIWEGILVLEGWVRDVVVPVYTLSALSYLLIDNYYDCKPSPSAKNKSSLRCSLSSFQIPPVLRKLSSLTLSSKDEDTDSLIPPTPVDEEEEEDEGEKPIDMNGVFKVVENDNFDKFLEAQGVPWFLCNAASKARPTHHFTHASSKKLTIKIQGIIESQTSYQINGPYTETSIRGRLFQDSLSYLYDENGDDKTCVGVQTRKVAMGQGYVVEVERRIIRAKSVWVPTPEENPDGHCTYDLGIPCDFDRLIMTNKVVYDEDKEPVIASQLFHRQD